MNKLLMASSAILLAIVSTLAWIIMAGMETSAPPPAKTAERTEYDQWVKALGSDESEIRDELNELITGTKIPLDELDKAKVGRLTFTCDDPKTLLDISFLAKFVHNAAAGEIDAFAFVTPEKRGELEVLAGPKPSAETILKLRTSLVKLGNEFERIRQNPDWKVEVTGEEKVSMPMLDLLREGYEFLPVGQHPSLRAKPVVPAFSASEAELLAQLQKYFNGTRARLAFPAGNYPKAYVEGRLPAIPTGLGEYRNLANTAILAEKKLLLPGDKPPPADAIEAVDDVYRKLEGFLDAVEQFGK